jgi:acyl carrier protein
VHGLFVLDALLQAEKLDFCLLVSSLSTVLGGLGFAAYAAANQFMDAFAARQNQLTTRWVSVNWDGWQFDELKATSGAFLGNLAILPNEGSDVIGRILACTLVPRVIVSTGDLLLRIRQWVLLEPLREVQEAPPAESTPLYSRPGLPNNYVAPRTEVEQIITDACQELLGIDQIGIDDNFFDLGGHSLLAIQLIHRLRDIFQVELSVRSLFDTPTVAGLADYIQTMSDAVQVADKVAQALDLVEQLSDEEIRILLSDKDSGNGRG